MHRACDDTNALSPCDQQHTADPFTSDDGPAVSTLRPAFRCPPGVSQTSSRPNDDADTGPWADLPRDLCNLVLDCSDAISVIRFPAVCTDWAAASKDDNHRSRLPSGSPTLLTSSLDPEGYDVEYNLEPGAFGLHDVATGKSCYGEAEGLKKRTWVGGKDDWLVTTDLKCSVELLNPITGVRVPLPPFATIPGVEVVEVKERGPGVSSPFQKSTHRYWFPTPSLRLRKVSLCRTPAHQDGYLAVALFSGDNASLVAFTAGKSWTPLTNPAEGLCCRRNTYTDVTVHKGKVLAVGKYGDICSWDMNSCTTSSEATILSPPADISLMDYDYSTRQVFYLATSSSGNDLQLVCMVGDNNEVGRDERWRRIVFDSQWRFWPQRVLLHELDAVTGAWRRVENLGGDRALFVGANYPFYVDVPRDGSRDHPPIQADCVYVADLISCDAGIFDLKPGYDFELNWDAHLYYPAMSEPLQMPMWFRPTAAYPTARVPVP